VYKGSDGQFVTLLPAGRYSWKDSVIAPLIVDKGIPDASRTCSLEKPGLLADLPGGSGRRGRIGTRFPSARQHALRSAKRRLTQVSEANGELAQAKD
jgi:hypothetical protein